MKRTFDKRKFRYASTSAALTALIIAAIIVFNIIFSALGSKFLWYVDLTPELVFTLTDECFDLIDTYEKTGVPLMMLENCCYGRREMMALNMREKGVFGEIVHCTGAYAHYLNKVELFTKI